eukprot:s2356_g24.t1
MPYFGVKMLFVAAKKEKVLEHLKLSSTSNTAKNPVILNCCIRAASEIDPKKYQLTESVLKQDNSKLAERVSLYLAGFPCTPYSSLGEQLGLRDPNARPLLGCVKRMKHVCVLENVMGFRVVAEAAAEFIAKNVSLKDSMKLFAKRYPKAAGQVTSMREMQALDLLLAEMGEISAANTSQSLHQMPVLKTDEDDMFCLTPGGKILSTSAGRYLIGREVLGLMGMPIQRLELSSFSENVLHSLGGNAMAMRSVLPLICAALSATVPGRLAM